MTKEETLIVGIEALIADYRRPALEPFRLVTPFEDLQAALDGATVPIHLVAGATYSGVTVPSGARLVGHGAILEGVGRPAIHVLPGTADVRIADVSCLCADWTGGVVQLGNADATQTTLAQVPRDIRLERVIVPRHRGKRGFSIHSTLTDLIDCEAHDIWTPGQDSQPWWIHNTPGQIRILGGAWSAGSELCLFGGAAFNIQKLVPTGIEVAGGRYYRPESWQTDGVDREVKCGLEVKNGADIWFHDLTVRGCWQFAQPVSAAFMLTPTQGGQVTGVRIEDILLENCTDVLSVSGRDAAGVNQTQTTGIVAKRIRGVLKKGTSRGVLVIAQRNVGTVAFEDCAIDTDGTKLIECVDPTAGVRLTGSTCRLGKYGFTFGGVHASVTPDPFAPNVAALEVTGNTFSGSGATARFQQRFPNNNYAV